MRGSPDHSGETGTERDTGRERVREISMHGIAQEKHYFPKTTDWEDKRD